MSNLKEEQKGLRNNSYATLRPPHQEERLFIYEFLIFPLSFLSHIALSRTGLDTDFHNQQVFFPTVTVCPFNAYSPNFLNETANFSLARNESETESDNAGDEDSSNNNDNYYQQVLKALPALSYDTFASIHEAARNLSQKVEMRDKNLRQLAFQVGIKCDELLEICKYKDEEIACCEYFMPLYSEHGLCYSFNTRYYSTADNEYGSDVV